MKRIDIRAYFNIGEFLEALLRTCAEKQGDGKLTEGDCRFLSELLDEVDQSLTAVEMQRTLDLTVHARKSLKNSTWPQAHTLFECMQVTAKGELAEKFVGYLPPERARFWGMEKPFGDKVFESFPSTRADFTAAGNCYAIEQYNACVFHLMRVIEKGLRVIARERGIKNIGGSRLEWHDWGTIIGREVASLFWTRNRAGISG